jgi:hypothetical protein
MQRQDHGPLPETREAVPAEHRLLFGFAVATAPSALPQMPST